MRLFPLLRIFAVLAPLALTVSEAEAAKRVFAVEVQSWTRQCRVTAEDSVLNCDLPQALQAAETQSFEVDIAEEILETRLSKRAFGEKGFKGELRFFSTYPDPNTGLPPYIQIQIEMIAPLRGLCLQSVRLRDPFLASPLACTSFDPSTGRQIGVNLKIVEGSSI